MVASCVKKTNIAGRLEFLDARTKIQALIGGVGVEDVGRHRGEEQGEEEESCEHVTFCLRGSEIFLWLWFVGFGLRNPSGP